MDNKTTILKEIARRVAAVKASAKGKAPVALDSSNQRHAAFAVLRAARLNSVANGLAGKVSDRLEKLEADLAKTIRAGVADGAEKTLTSLVRQAFEWIKGEVADDMFELADILHTHAGQAATEHFGVAVDAHRGNRELSVMGASVREHLDKVRDDLVFRLTAAFRRAVAAGCTASEVVKRLGLEEPVVKASEFIHATDPLSAISIGIRLFDTTDNSILKLVQAAVTELATQADDAAADDMDDEDDEDGEPKMGYAWVSAADANVCEYCQYMDGGRWDRDKEPVGESPELEQEPPAHFGCRCALIPCDLSEDAPKGNFQSYLASFSDEEQEKAFGKPALTAYRRGEITPAGLMGQRGNRIDLEQFRELEPRLELDVEKFGRMGAESAKEANRVTVERRAARAIGDMESEPFKEVPSA